MKKGNNTSAIGLWIIITVILALLTAYFLIISNNFGNDTASICGNNDEPCIVIYTKRENTYGNLGVTCLVLGIISIVITVASRPKKKEENRKLKEQEEILAAKQRWDKRWEDQNKKWTEKK